MVKKNSGTATISDGHSVTTSPAPTWSPLPTPGPTWSPLAAEQPLPALKKKKPKQPQASANNPPPAPGGTAQPQETSSSQKKKKKAKQQAHASANASVSGSNPTTNPGSTQPHPVHTPVAPHATSHSNTPNSTASTSTAKTSSSATSAATTAVASPTPVSRKSKVSPEFDLLEGQVKEDKTSHQVVTAPLITRDAFEHDGGLAKDVPQYGVLGSIVSVHAQGSMEVHKDKRIYLNTNAPFSAVVCGVQGSGKSHTVGVMLESMLIANDPRLGILPKPLSALVLHFGESGAGAQPCEAAYQCLTTDPNVKPPPITVFVSPTQYNTMWRLYQAAFGKKVQVLPLKIYHAELDAKSILSMMSVSSNNEPPLYVQIILSSLERLIGTNGDFMLQNILRELGETFTYTRFKLKLEERAQTFNPAQKAMCDQRLSLLESFLEHDGKRARFKAGEVTIIDLTDPFINAAGACSLFEIITRLFIRAKVDTGKVLVVDEAHKYLTKDQGSEVLTQTLLSIVRQQRHLGTRLILSTQEPTVVPEALLDLCSITIMHRFSSITWFNHLAKHVSSDFGDEAFDAVVQLQTGQALVLAPAGLGVFQAHGMDKPERKIFGRRYLIVKTRRRVTADGGASILVV
ncbi:hypothetical protein FRC04_007695 [Tulasnella sp. 424]|nr:hypothetical protein FRC04_007695 [Tulasnella sp. 424]KAG8979126.1 hypothetical protein FRC05_009336 [Tulasnella sp. 425]